MFFPFANEQAQQNDPVKKSVLARPICISDRVGYTHGKLHRAPFFNTSALPPCGFRSKATIGLRKKRKI